MTIFLSGKVKYHFTVSHGTVQPWVLISHIIVHCELQLEEGVLANPNSRAKDIRQITDEF